MGAQRFYFSATLQSRCLKTAVAGKLVKIMHQLLATETNHFGVVSDVASHESRLGQGIECAFLNGSDVTLGDLEMLCHLSQ